MKHYTYKSCSDLPIYNFHKVMETSNYAYLVKGWDEHTDVVLDKDKMAGIWVDIYKEYCVLTNNNKALQYYRKKGRLFYLEMKKLVVGRLLLQLSVNDLDEDSQKVIIDEIREWKFDYAPNIKDTTAIENVLRLLRVQDNEIGLLKSSLKELEEKGDDIPLIKQVVKVEQLLGRTEIDPRKTSVEKWVYMMDEIKEITAQRLKEINKSRRR